MDITSKFIYAKTKAAFEAQLPSIPQNLNPIVFIEDTREMWTMGTYFSIGYPAIQVSETQGVVKVDIANSFFTISTSGASLSVQKGAGNDIIISSNALTKVDTASPLEWDTVTKRLLHSTSGASAGTYGQSTTTENASILNIPYLTVNATGHITNISTKAVSIRDYVEQLAPNELLGDRNVLLSYNEVNTNSDTAQVHKARGLTFNSLSQILTVEGGANINGPTNVTNGDLTVTGGDIVGNLRGNVTGEATPKIHISTEPEYGGASTEMYGHVKVQDNLGVIAPSPSSNNSDPGKADVTLGVAASPYMVWSVKQDLEEQIFDIPTIGGIQIGHQILDITNQGQVVEIQASQGVSATIEEGIVKIKGIEISGLDSEKNTTTLTNKLTIGEDFIIDGSDNKLSIRWLDLT